MDANGLTVIERGNTDIECLWEAPSPDSRRYLPGHEHLQGVEYEPLPKACPWLTENRSFAIAGALAVVGIYLGWIA